MKTKEIETARERTREPLKETAREGSRVPHRSRVKVGKTEWRCIPQEECVENEKKEEEVNVSRRGGVMKREGRKGRKVEEKEKKKKKKKRNQIIRKRHTKKRRYKEMNWWKMCRQFAESLLSKEAGGPKYGGHWGNLENGSSFY